MTRLLSWFWSEGDLSEVSIAAVFLSVLAAMVLL